MNKLEQQVDAVRNAIASAIDFPLIGACLYHAMFVKLILDVPVVAGSAAWRFTTRDNGLNNTHFGYQFFQDEFIRWNNDKATNLPEIHIWNSYNNLVLDLSTIYLPKQLKKILGYNWDSSLIPPEFYFGASRSQNCLYEYDSIATQFANETIDKIIAEHGIVVVRQ
jgi:hypothetical protein